ncbi:MAG: CHAT domain-containing protein [Coleofasciculus sp. S288]|nr:CHAT domain-containing protein [Coleofasciculus sp. S288]
MRTIGRLEQSEQILKRSLEIVDSLSSSPEQAERLAQARSAILLSLGNTLRARGNLERDRVARTKYDYMPWRLREEDSPISDISLYQKAYNYYKSAIFQDGKSCSSTRESSLSTYKIKAQLNCLSLILDVDGLENYDFNSIKALESKIYQGLTDDNVPNIIAKIYAQINIAKSLVFLLQKTNKNEKETWNLVEQILNKKAFENAKKLKNERIQSRIQSYILGNLGGLYEYFAWQCENKKQDENIGQCQNAQQCRDTAKELTKKALYLAQPTEAPDIAYQWQWQLGRLLDAEGEGKREEAIASYEAAIKTLESVRSDLLSINSDVQFSFRDNIEPIYRELVSLLLPSGETKLSQENQENLQKSLYYVESLQLAELENRLQCSLRNISPVRTNRVDNQNEPIKVLLNRLDQVLDTDQQAAFIYPIILKDRLAVILKVRGKPLFYTATKKDKEIVQNTINSAYENLTSSAFYEGQETPLKTLYQWLIHPFDKLLKENAVKTLIFILDSSLRRIPMAALHDGQQFLIQKSYAVALAYSVQLLKPKNSEPVRLNALIAGAIKKRPNFDPPDWVSSQIDSVKDFFKNPKILLGAEFTKKSFQDEVVSSSYNLIHLATHGQFSSNPQETYIITDDDSNVINQYAININEFGKLLRSGKPNRAIELLVLSACQTASGDNRAVLGIAGIAVRSGANSTIAPLWKVDQESSKVLMEKFYENLVKNNMSKVEALHLAQQSLLKTPDVNKNTPYHWAPFILVGN